VNAEENGVVNAEENRVVNVEENRVVRMRRKMSQTFRDDVFGVVDRYFRKELSTDNECRVY
jgi:hypothetical protein